MVMELLMVLELRLKRVWEHVIKGDSACPDYLCTYFCNIIA